MSKENLLIIFTKNPVLGKVKTRLAKGVGDKKALEIYKFLLKHTKDITGKLNVNKQVYYAWNIAEDDIWKDGGFQKRLQVEGDLGEKMEAAFKTGFDEGYKKILIIGSDLYDLETTDLEDAFEELEAHDYVIGPAEDGGYYLLGMKSLNSALFINKAWSTSSVFEQSLQDMNNGTYKALPLRNDIDTLEDIKDHPAFQKIINNDR
ncbi:TIGR04282 family arsenosugar biosynthesis glycosyltransferase [uncultured Christiangramia sp.]|uniref:TIGR04282 family arsenosugar biosynthesis glycosyltransferase n=1 Tax=uncultured Christiangramia sp. TaxID=503836 RepID=UPI00263875EC|nr:TIGR04282 family arsenosugar biosynthesis glycosyltransferase [uncultured Christiangramia sp.]